MADALVMNSSENAIRTLNRHAFGTGPNQLRLKSEHVSCQF